MGTQGRERCGSAVRAPLALPPPLKQACNTPSGRTPGVQLRSTAAPHTPLDRGEPIRLSDVCLGRLCPGAASSPVEVWTPPSRASLRPRTGQQGPSVVREAAAPQEHRVAPSEPATLAVGWPLTLTSKDLAHRSPPWGRAGMFVFV